MEHLGMKRRVRSMNISTALLLTTGLLFLGATGISMVLVYDAMQDQALREAALKERLLLDHNLAIHTYFSHELKPKLFELLDSMPSISEDYFEPSWMSSTYAVRQIDDYFKTLSRAEYSYKEAAINARSPLNEADAFERAFLEDLNANPDLESRSEIRTFDGEPYLVVLRRGEMMEESCLRCHSSPEMAPSDLVEQYGPNRSFGRKSGDAVSAISTRVPLAAAYASADRVFSEFAGILIAVLLALFGVQFWLMRRCMITPLARVQDAAAQVASSPAHLGEQIPIPAGRELRELTAAFNAMSAKLRVAYDHLEDRVTARTAELATTNVHLEHEIEGHKKAEEALQHRTYELGERIKELHCLYEISRLVEQPGISLDGILRGTVESIPAGWQYPDITCARLTLDGEVFSTPNFQETSWMQTADILVHGERAGRLDVGYLEERPEDYEGPFLHEERTLLNVISGRLGRIIKGKRMENALRESEQKYHDLIENLNEGIWAIDHEAYTTFVNSRMAEMLGYTAEEMQGRHLFSFMDERRVEIGKRELERRQQGIEEHHYFEFLKKDGTRIHVSMQTGPITDDAGTYLGAIAAVQDMTEQFRLKREYETLFREMLDGFALHEIICDQEGTPVDYRFLEVNPAFEQMTDLHAQEIIGKTVLEVLPGTEASWIETYGQVVLTGEPIFFENYAQAFDKYFQVTAFRPFPNQFASIFVDITERKRMENQLREALDAKTALLQEVHHRTRNNMQVLSVLIAMHLRTLDHEPTRQFLQGLQDRIDAMALVHRKLHRDDLTTVNVSDYIQELAQNLLDQYQRSPGRITLTFEMEPFELTIDPAVPFGLLLHEIFSNALKRAFPGEKGGTIHVSLHTLETGQRELRVSDTGVGLPEEFDADTASSLGVRLMTILAQQLGGSIEFQRQTPTGTTVILRFHEPQYKQRI
ncbi:DUF3365 domain-containing protein [candidate division KSB3 bacterium]|uniref:histidine kinase n=1 Tax=candidate division KSB3 bacterium TaxID=2044937 RepID=A0A9D5JW60_9BACT|nr:DUF3365 domain-containing protein [candidate division KSB3 bacterium]MBD3325255.1 DUF3365 domain-containing protein [candidate division KSB3 bacterium]